MISLRNHPQLLFYAFFIVVLNSCSQPHDFRIVPGMGDWPIYYSFDEDLDYHYIEKGKDLTLSTNANPELKDKYEWVWDFGDGTISTETFSTTHSWDEPGEYDVTLSIKNGKFTKTHTVQVFVTGTAYKFNGIYSGVVSNESNCGKSVENINLLLTSSIESDSLTLTNLSNEVDEDIKVITTDSPTFEIPTGTVITFSDNSQWEVHSSYFHLNEYSSGEFKSSWCIYDDASFTGSCGLLTSDMVISK